LVLLGALRAFLAGKIGLISEGGKIRGWFKQIATIVS
jgi:hypothetical protein